MADYVIGDVHGQYDALMRLLDKVDYNENRDKLWFVGDLVNRGPKSLKALRFVTGLGGKANVVVGNHDYSLMVQALNTPKIKIKKTTAEILAAPDGEELVMAIRRWPLMVEDENRNVVMVHAGLYPHWSLACARAQNAAYCAMMQGEKSIADARIIETFDDGSGCWEADGDAAEQMRFTVNAFARMRFLEKNGRLNFDAKVPPRSAPRSLTPWYKLHPADGAKVIFGHWAALGLTIKPRWACIDGGAAWGGELIAFNIDNWKVAAKAAVSGEKKK